MLPILHDAMSTAAYIRKIIHEIYNESLGLYTHTNWIKNRGGTQNPSEFNFPGNGCHLD